MVGYFMDDWGIEAPKRLDISNADLLYGLKCCTTARESDRSQVEAQLETLWGPNALTALSVRTAFDAYLNALRLDSGSHVLMSAVTIPDMVKIVEAHGLVPLAIDIDLDTLAPRLDLMNNALTERTKVVVVSHIFGSICDMNEIIEWAHDHGLVVVEDCAEAYCGPKYRGHDEADISLFSFGTIKTETALGGALLRFSDPAMRGAVQALLNDYAVQPLSVFTKRLVKYSAFNPILKQPKLYATFIHGVQSIGKSHIELLLANSRGFIGQDLFEGIRLRPPVALLMLLKRRLETFNAKNLERRRKKCDMAAKLLQKVEGIVVPGSRAVPHYHWLFPILVDQPNQVATKLLAHGFDATAATTSLVCVDNVVTEKGDVYNRVFSGSTMVSSKLMKNILYLPIDGTTSDRKIQNLVKTLSSTGSKL